MKSHRRRASSPARGFTLIEVLIAMTIVAVALMAAIRAAGGMTESARLLRERTLALWSAENRLAQIRVQRDFPDVGRRVFDCPQGDLALRCQEDVYSSPNPGFRRVEIQVFDASPRSSGQRLARLMAFATMQQR